MPDSIPCNRCGAPLRVGASARFVTCGRCGAELAVQRTRSAVFTESMSDADAPGDTAGPPLAPDLHRDLARLDREWGMERQQYMIMNRYGRRYVPTLAGTLMVSAAVIGFGGVWTATAVRMGDANVGRFDPFPFLGIVIMVLGVVVGTASYLKARRYQRAYDEYRRRRQELLAHEEGD